MALGANILGYENTRVVVTGSASGMGEATARMLGELGAEVHAIDVEKPSIPHAAYYETDLRDPDAIDATVARLKAVGPIDRLFNCAGVPHTTGPLNCMLVNWVGLRYSHRWAAAEHRRRWRHREHRVGRRDRLPGLPRDD